MRHMLLRLEWMTPQASTESQFICSVMNWIYLSYN